MQRLESSADSNDGGVQNDSKWFHQFNQNPSANLDSDTMDGKSHPGTRHCHGKESGLTSAAVDPPFFQNQSGGSEAGPRDPIPHELLPNLNTSAPAAAPPLGHSKSSSTEDYRSVIDDLTVEIRRLKDELRRYRHAEDDGALRKQRLFEIKTHGLPQWKKRELEATLRDFAAGLGGTSSTDASSSMRKKSSRASRLRGPSSMSKHASSSSGSHLRPVDSAYASMSTGNTSGNSQGRHSKRANSRDTEQKVEDYLNDIPEGLYPRHITMSDREKKKLVVRRLEQLFTGKARGKHSAEAEFAPPAGDDAGPSREARILPTTNPKGRTASAAASGSATQSNTNLTSQSNTDLTSWSGNKSGGNGNDNASGSGSGRGSGNGSSNTTSNISPGSNPPFEQRPTRPRDLDPDRMPDPSENMEYLRHLGVTPAPGHPGSSGARASGSPAGVAADAEGWVYLNLLSNLAQLHIFNVAPSFVRAAVAEKSAKFQLSSDGRKIRWRGGSDGTAFSSESSGQASGEGDEGESSDRSRKRRRRDGSGEASSGDASGFGSSESFHYKPLFARMESPGGQTSQGSSASPESGSDSYNSSSGHGSSHSASSRRRKRRVDGAIIYYSGEPFCTDLSGDPGCLSPSTHMASSGSQEGESGEGASGTLSASLAYRPLSAKPAGVAKSSGAMDTSSDAVSEASGELEAEFPWSDSKQESRVRPLEPCGLGGVVPEDNFVMTITTLRPKDEAPHPPSPPEAKAASLVERLASRTRKHPRPSTPLDIEYVGGRIKRLRPATLPPPAVFLPPFSSSDESSDWGDESEADDEVSLQASSSRRVHPHQSDKSVQVLGSGGEESTVESSADEVPGAESVKGVRGRGRGGELRGSLAATAGGASSGYSSSQEGSGG